MKKMLFGLLLAFTALMLGASFDASAQATPPAQSVNAGASVTFARSDGTANTGGYSDGTSAAKITGVDPVTASGNAAATGAAAGSFVQGVNNATASEKGVVSSIGNVDAATTTSVIGGNVQQGNVANVGPKGSTTFSGATNETEGVFQGAASAAAPLTGSGNGLAQGNSAVSASGDGTNHAVAKLNSTGSSTATGKFNITNACGAPTLSSAVSGTGNGGLQALAGNPKGDFGVGGAKGGGTYGTNNTTGAPVAGSVVLQGAAESAIGAHTVTVSSVMTVTAAAK